MNSRSQMKRPKILETGHVMNKPAEEWTDGHILGNGDLGVVAYGNADALKWGLSKHNVYNLECEMPHGVRPEKTYLEMLETFKKEGFASIYHNPDKKAVPSDKPYQDRQTPLSLGIFELQPMPGICKNTFCQTLTPYNGTVKTKISPVDWRFGYGLRYPDVIAESFVDSDANALHIRVSIQNGSETRLFWNYRWPQHIAGYYESTFCEISQAEGSFRAELGEASGSFKVKLYQSGKDAALSAGKFGLDGMITVTEDCPVEFVITAVSCDEPEVPVSDFAIACERTAAWWEDFWSRSLVWYEEEDLDSLWAMGLYALGASTRPDKSAPNLQGIWNQSPQAIWHSDFHFNTNLQECQWACGASNHPELAKAMMRMLIRDWREELRLHAKEAYGVDGAVSLGVGMDWKGRALGGWWSVLSVSNTAWTAITLWDQYLFDPDPEYLRTDLYPFLKECCALYDGIMERDEDGIWHTTLSSSPERVVSNAEGERYSLCGRDCTINVATIRVLFDAAAQAADILGEDSTHYRLVASHMPPLPVYDGVLIEMETGYFHDGNRPGITKECHRHPSRLMPIFPAGLISLNSSEEELELGIRSYRDFFVNGMGEMRGWSRSYLANIAARLGLGEEAEFLLKDLKEHYLLPGLLSSHEPVREKSLFQIEALLAIPAAVNEMLLQSVDGVIRVFPAVAKGRDCGFKRLRARGNILVSAEMESGQVKYIVLESDHPAKVRLASPWKGTEVMTEWGKMTVENGYLVLDLLPEEAITVTEGAGV